MAAATRAPLAAVPQTQQQSGISTLCDYCHQKPRFSNHNYCSKKCASQATSSTSLCNHCQKKPKFQNFDFCGKTCASLAAQSGGSGNAQPAAKPHTPNAKPSNPGGSKKGNQQNGAIDPMQVAKLVIQQIPQLQSFINQTQAHLQPLYQHQQGPVAQPSSSQAPVHHQTSMNIPAGGSPLPSTSRSIPPTVHLAPAAGNGGISSISMPSMPHASIQIQQQDALCRIPDCGKFVHVDPSGQNTSEYCSMSHRQEAVSSGLVEPCIMCLDLPQSGNDYFCGRACREEALNKHMIPVRDDA
ncbi:hypothetical protein PM082_022603 [Marasmius tenuissimus]|nr:hypothetical protein PM082_022603 [Marasmius tenuissimus]